MIDSCHNPRRYICILHLANDNFQHLLIALAASPLTQGTTAASRERRAQHKLKANRQAATGRDPRRSRTYSSIIYQNQISLKRKFTARYSYHGITEGVTADWKRSAMVVYNPPLLSRYLCGWVSASLNSYCQTRELQFYYYLWFFMACWLSPIKEHSRGKCLLFV